MLTARAVNQRDVYVAGFSFPVVPQDKGRIRFRISVAGSKPQLGLAAATLEAVGREAGLVGRLLPEIGFRQPFPADRVLIFPGLSPTISNT